MHILVLGSHGMLGRALTRALQDDHDVTAWDREELDITDERAVGELLPMLDPDIVMNAAAHTDVEKAEDDPDTAEAVNGYAVGNLAVTCAEADLPLLHFSTDYVFDGRKAEGYREDDEPAQSLSVYGRSKLLGETLLKENGREFWLVRTAWLFGPHGKHFIDTILAAAEQHDLLKVVDDQRGSPTSALDLAASLCDFLRDRPPYGTYHLVNSGEATWADLAEAALAQTGRTTRVERVPTRAYPLKAVRPACSVLRNTKRPPLRPWREALAAYLRVREHVRP